MIEYYNSFEITNYCGCYQATNEQESFTAERLADIYELINNRQTS
jgi:hypothetical protein